MDACMGTKGPRAVLLQNRRSSARTARGGLECGMGRRFKFEIEVLTTDGVSDFMFWNAKNDFK